VEEPGRLNRHYCSQGKNEVLNLVGVGAPSYVLSYFNRMFELFKP